MREKIINILHRCTTGDASIDKAAEQIEKLFEESQIGQQFSIFDEQTHHTKEQIEGLEIRREESFITFDGSDIIQEFDHSRLGKQMKRIHALMIDGAWRTLSEIENLTGDPQSSISAQLRNFRKPKFGANIVDKRRRGDKKNGLFEYKLTINK